MTSNSKMFDLLMKDLEAEINRVHRPRERFKGDGFTTGYIQSFLVTLLQKLPEPAREQAVETIVDRIIYLRSCEPEVPVKIVQGEAA